MSGAFKKGNRCPKCNQSKGEKIIEEYLNNNMLNFIAQYSFDIAGFRLYEYDFAITGEDNRVKALIEYDGEQHFRFVEYFHKTMDNFKKSVERDNIKNDLAKNNNIPILRIRYDDNVEVKLECFLKAL